MTRQTKMLLIDARLRLTNCRLRFILDAWEESKHPRDKDGKFCRGGSNVTNENDEEVKVIPSDKYYMPVAKIKDFLLKPGAKHSKEFFDVGYTENDVEKLNKDIEAQFDETKAVEFRYSGDFIEFNIYMQLGVNKKKRFRTVWRKDTPDKKPRFITAYRKDE